MANVTIQIPDALIPRVTAAARALRPDLAGLSDIAAFKRISGDYWIAVLNDYETRMAAQAAAMQAQSDGAGIG